MKSNLSICIFISAVAPVSASTNTKECPVPTYGQKYNEQHFPIPFKSLVIFGDSYSDVGNTYTLTNNGTGISPWSFEKSRYSDGRVWNEYMAQYFDMSLPMPSSTSNSNPNNYAWGGATTNNNYIPSESSYANVVVPGVNDQVDTYIQDQQRRRRSDKNDTPPEEKEKLFCLYSGYNDYWWYVYRDFETTKGQQFDLIEVSNHVVDDIIANVAKLYDEGARYFLVANVVPMSQYTEAFGRTQEVRDSYDILVENHNTQLSKLLDEFEMKHPDVIVYQFDVHSAMNCINNETKRFLGFEELEASCHPTKSEDCGNIFSYKFWDDYHPTTHSHYIQAMWAIESIYMVESSSSLMSRSWMPLFWIFNITSVLFLF